MVSQSLFLILKVCKIKPNSSYKIVRFEVNNLVGFGALFWKSVLLFDIDS